MPDREAWLRAASRLPSAALAVAAANAVWLAFRPHYDLHIGPARLGAHGIFKPLIFLDAAFLLAVLVRRSAPEGFIPAWSRLVRLRGLLILSTVLAVYTVSFGINYHHTEWAHVDISAAHPTLRSLARFFYERQYDGFYRPLALISLWADWKIFGDALRWYHLQSLALHALNALLVARLARDLGLKSAVSIASALVFAVSPAVFETVIWPGARFDELAVLFSLAALVLGLEYAAGGRPGVLAAAAGCLALGLISKETAYAVPLLLPFLAMRRAAENPTAAERKRWVRAGVAFCAVGGVAVAVRALVLGGIGGYHADGASLHLAIHPKTFTSILTRAPLAGLAAIDATVRLPWWAQADVALFALLLVYIACALRHGPDRRAWCLLACLLVSLLPMANLMAFVGPALVQGRYLYFASVWAALFVAWAIVRTPRPRAVLTAWVLLAGTAAFFNAYVHRARLDALPGAVARIAADHAAASRCRTVALVAMPDQTNGNLFFSDELLRSTKAALPGVDVEFRGGSTREGPPPSACLAYAWDDSVPPFGRLKEIPAPAKSE